MKTYGKMVYNSKHHEWHITSEPHVSLRLKRVFGKADSRASKVIKLSATPANCRDLEWFIVRYPLEVEPLAFLSAQAADHREGQSVYEQLSSGLVVPKPFDLKMPARDYQTTAARMWLAMHGILLGDDVGLGKTVSSLCGLMEPGLLPTMVVTLTHLPPQWEEEIAKFTGLTTHILKKGTPYNITKWHDGRFPDVIISNYSKLAGWAETLGGGLLHSLIFDEIQELRHSGSQKYNAAQLLRSYVQWCIGLSATPIFNYGGEIFNPLEIIRPGCLGTEEEFQREWCSALGNGRYKLSDPKAFSMYIKEEGLMLRRTRQEVGRELPPTTIVPHYVTVDPGAVMKMKGRAMELAKLVLRQGEAFKGQKMKASSEFDMELRRSTGLAKAPYVADFIRLLHEESGEKIVVYLWHRDVYEVMLEKLKDLKPVMYTGSESPAQKEASRKAFVEGDAQLMFISLRSAAGLNSLQGVCHICVFGELDWSDAVYIQDIGRLRRDGMDEQENVVAYFMLAREGSDPVMMEVSGVKKQQLQGIMDPNQADVGATQVEEAYIKRLAQNFLEQHGESVPTTAIEELEMIA